MAKFIPGTGNRTFVLSEAAAVDLVNADGDVPTGMLCPEDDAHVVHITYTVQTTGGDSENHQLVLEHGLGAAGVALTASINVANDAAAGAIVTGDGLAYASQPATVRGTQIQILNTEGGAISNGLILDVSILWEL